MGLHLFIFRSWYFLALAFVGTLHVSIPLAIATYYVALGNEPLTIMMYVPVFFLGITYLNMSAMRAVMRSYKLIGEPDFVNTVKALFRHLSIDTILPLFISFLLAALIAFGFRFATGGDLMFIALFDANAAEELRSLMALAQSVTQMDLPILVNIFTVMPYIYLVMLCVFGVSIAAGAANASANPPGHLPVHGLGERFWFIVVTLVVNGVLVAALAGGAGLGAVVSQMAGIQILPAIGFGVMGLFLLLGYFNLYVVFALAYCDYETEQRQDRAVLSDLMRYGMRDEALDIKALRHSRSSGGLTVAD